MKNLTNDKQASLFSGSRERGSSEWGAFNTIKHDRVPMFDVSTRKVQKEYYSNMSHISRFLRRIPLKPAR